MSSEQKPSFIEVLSRYWFIIAFFIGMAVTWGTFLSQNETMKAKIQTLEANDKEYQVLLTNIQIDIREIKTSLEFIKDNVR